jgi:hydrogenase/urease accessory protein HupE
MAPVRWIAALCLLLSVAWAHDLRPGAIALRETAPNVFQMQLIPPLDGGGRIRLDPPELPDGCRYTTPIEVRCANGLQGAMRLPRLARRRVKVVVHVRWLDGRRVEVLLREGETRAQLDTPRLGWAAVELGITHIWQGWDHLGFVLMLALIAGTPRRIAIAVTGFTVAHSLTLGATVLGLVHPPGPATELIIALSVLLVAAEAARGRETLASRYPALVAGLFGAVHGFGFAGILASLEIPAEALPTTLLAFNLGVELGQLGVLAIALGGARLVGKRIPHGRRLVAYGVGVPAAVWTIQRGLVWWG